MGIGQESEDQSDLQTLREIAANSSQAAYLREAVEDLPKKYEEPKEGKK